MHLLPEIRKYLEQHRFRVLKTRADRLHPDERHVVVVQTGKDQRGDPKLLVFKQTLIKKYSIGETIYLKCHCSTGELDAAIMKVEYNVKTLGTVMTEAFREPEDMRKSHQDLLAIVKRLPTDFEPVGTRSRDTDYGPDCSCGCAFFVPLEGLLGMDWGVCTNPASSRAGLLTFEHQGCKHFVQEESCHTSSTAT